MELKAQALFPSVVWSTLFDDHTTLNKELLARAYELRNKDPSGVSRTNIAGWQSNNTIQQLPEFALINRRILQACERIAESQYFIPGLTFDHQAWVNISPPGASNQIHYHANCYFSGVYYISLDAPKCGSLFFRDPRTASRMMPFPATKQTPFTASEVRMPPEPGRLYIFPGWLEHGVEVNQSDSDRVGISCNVVARP
ncbi:MAG: hypothetical protein ISP89_03810 [Pseudomonadales bacterium]|nr:hypothetical protein [Pseudomonadales bacterium]